MVEHHTNILEIGGLFFVVFPGVLPDPFILS
jgi:hypothetical protein